MHTTLNLFEKSICIIQRFAFVVNFLISRVILRLQFHFVTTLTGKCVELIYVSYNYVFCLKMLKGFYLASMHPYLITDFQHQWAIPLPAFKVLHCKMCQLKTFDFCLDHSNIVMGLRSGCNRCQQVSLYCVCPAVLVDSLYGPHYFLKASIP